MPDTQQAGRQVANLADAKAGSPKSSSGTYADRREALSAGIASIQANEINKPRTPRPSGSTADYPNV